MLARPARALSGPTALLGASPSCSGRRLSPGHRRGHLERPAVEVRAGTSSYSIDRPGRCDRLPLERGNGQDPRPRASSDRLPAPAPADPRRHGLTGATLDAAWGSFPSTSRASPARVATIFDSEVFHPRRPPRPSCYGELTWRANRASFYLYTRPTMHRLSRHRQAKSSRGLAMDDITRANPDHYKNREFVHAPGATHSYHAQPALRRRDHDDLRIADDS